MLCPIAFLCLISILGGNEGSKSGIGAERSAARLQSCKFNKSTSLKRFTREGFGAPELPLLGHGRLKKLVLGNSACVSLLGLGQIASAHEGLAASLGIRKGL